MTEHSVVWRVATFWIGYAGIFLGLGLVLGMVPPGGRLLVAGLLVTVGSVALTRVVAQSEGRSLEAAGARWSQGSISRFSAGLAFGAAMVALQVALSWVAFGPLTFVRNSTVDGSAVFVMAATYVALSAGEELGFRGYPFFRLRDRYGTALAQAVVALAFALYHMLQGWPAANALIGTTAGSVLFGSAVLASRGLAFPIGIHAAWNLGSWLLGTKDEAGYWRMEVARQLSFVAAAAVYLTVMAAAMVVMWWWMRVRNGQTRDRLSEGRC